MYKFLAWKQNLRPFEREPLYLHTDRQTEWFRSSGLAYCTLKLKSIKIISILEILLEETFQVSRSPWTIILLTFYELREHPVRSTFQTFDYQAVIGPDGLLMRLYKRSTLNWATLRSLES